MPRFCWCLGIEMVQYSFLFKMCQLRSEASVFGVSLEFVFCFYCKVYVRLSGFLLCGQKKMGRGLAHSESSSHVLPGPF